jgi:hypothetical protein
VRLLEGVIQRSVAECQQALFSSWLRVKGDPEGTRAEAKALEGLGNRIMANLRELQHD